ncbi:MAG: peptidyl-prolyl cis-trans isomerase, partial [Candidatus Zixiibacteriota bacterium]
MYSTRRSVVLLLVLGVLGLALTQCTRPTAVAPEANLPDTLTVAAFGDNYTMTLGQLKAKMDTSYLKPWGGLVEDTVAEHFRDSLLLDTLSGLAADSVDLVKHYHAYRIFQQLYYEFLIKTFWEEEVFKKLHVDSLEAVQFYYDHPDKFKVKEQVNLYQILISPKTLLTSPDSAFFKRMSPDRFEDWMREHAENLYRLLCYGEAFQNVAYIFSHDVESRENGGHVGWTTRGVYLDPFDSVAFALKPGEFSKPYRDKDGWHLLYIDGYLPEGPVPIDSPQVYQSARQSLLAQKANRILAKTMDSLVATMELKYNDSIIDADVFTLPDPLWAAVVNGEDTIDCRYLKQLEPGYREQYKVRNTTGDLKKQMIRDAARPFRVVQLARAHHTDTLPKVRKKRDEIRHHRAKIVVAQRAYDRTWRPSELQMRAYYDDHIDDYVFKKPLTFEMLTVQDSAFGAFLREQAAAGLDLEELAAEQRKLTGERIEYSPPRTVGEEDVPRILFLTARKALVGAVAPLIHTEQGYHIVRLLGYKESMPFLRAQGQIKALLIERHDRQVWNGFRDRMFAAYKVRFPH